MPRLKPAPAFITAQQAADMLDDSNAALYTYAEKGWLKRYGPPARKHKFYKLSEVEALIATRSTFDEYQEALPSFFDKAVSSDLPQIINNDRRSFQTDLARSAYPAWFEKKPETLFVLKDQRGKVIGFLFWSLDSVVWGPKLSPPEPRSPMGCVYFARWVSFSYAPRFSANISFLYELQSRDFPYPCATAIYLRSGDKTIAKMFYVRMYIKGGERQ